MTCVPAPRNGLLHEGGVVLKVHSGHRYRPHRTVRLRLNTQVREKEGRDRPFSVFEPHNREQTYASGIPFCSAYCPERTHKYTFYPIKMQEIPTKTSFMDNYSFAAPCRQPPPFACLPSCLLLPPSTFHLPPPACRQPPAVSHPPPAVSFHPCALAICRPTAPHKPLHPSRDELSLPAATDFPSRLRRTKKMRPEGRIRKFSNICQTDIYKFN